jgi:ferritin-like metal-binding protein YciE
MPLDMVRGDKAGRNARDGYATEHMEIASYQLLERVARRAGDEETAEVARQNRAEEEAMARKLDEHWDLFADLSLRADGVTV